MRRVLGFVTTASVGLILWVGPGFACTESPGIDMQPLRGVAGASVAVTGQNFLATAAPVKLYWGGTGGVTVGSAQVDAEGRFSTAFAPPADARTGEYVVSAIQLKPDGSVYGGTPANFMFQVQAAGLSSGIGSLNSEPTVQPLFVPDAVSLGAPVSEGGRSSVPVGLLALAVLGAGSAAVVYESRRSR